MVREIFYLKVAVSFNLALGVPHIKRRGSMAPIIRRKYLTHLTLLMVRNVFCMHSKFSEIGLFLEWKAQNLFFRS